MGEVVPVQLGQRGDAHGPAMPGLDRMSERLARSLRGIIEPYAGVRPTVTPQPIDNSMFMMWDACTPAFTSLSLYHIAPIQGVVILRLDSVFVCNLVDRFYGGAGKVKDLDRAEFTPTEDRLIDKLAQQIMGAVKLLWAELLPVDVSHVGHETNVAQISGIDSNGDIVCQAFEIALSDNLKWTMEIVYPAHGLAALEIANNDAQKGGVSASMPVDPVWQSQLNRKLGEVRLPARSVLARPNLNVTELMALKPGDVIPLHIARSLPLIIGDRVFAHGTIGEQDGRAAFLIDKLA